MVRELQNVDELYQLLGQNQVVAILFYRDMPIGMDPIPQMFSGMSEQYNNVACAQVNVDRHPDMLEASRGGPMIQPPCILVYRNGNVINGSGELDPISAPGRIAGLLEEVAA